MRLLLWGSKATLVYSLNVVDDNAFSVTYLSSGPLCELSSLSTADQTNLIEPQLLSAHESGRSTTAPALAHCCQIEFLAAIGANLFGEV